MQKNSTVQRFWKINNKREANLPPFFIDKSIKMCYNNIVRKNSQTETEEN